MTELEEARRFFANDKYATEATGIEIEAVGEHYAKCRLVLDERHKNAVGHVMGGVMFTLADFVFAISTNFKQPITVSVVSQISHLSSPKGDVLFGESRLIKDGKHTCFYEIDITDNLGTNVAVVSITGSHLNIKSF
ncbi:MAG: PaaI family thioesterase [Clostridia bacterium]|nr:PaaI family thioesterase [Clostridia bacterium]